MGIIFYEEEKLFKLDTKNTTYVIGIIDQEGFLGHAYYGKFIEDIKGAAQLMRIKEAPFTPEMNSRDRLSCLDCYPIEYSISDVIL